MVYESTASRSKAFQSPKLTLSIVYHVHFTNIPSISILNLRWRAELEFFHSFIQKWMNAVFYSHCSVPTSQYCTQLSCQTFKTAVRQIYSTASLTSTVCFSASICLLSMTSPEDCYVHKTVAGCVMCWIHCKHRAARSVCEMLVWHIIHSKLVLGVARLDRESISPPVTGVVWHVGSLSVQTLSSWSFLSAWGRPEESDRTGCWPCPGTWSGSGRRATGTCCPQKETVETEALPCISSDFKAVSVW